MTYERFEAAAVPRWRERLGQYWKLVRGDRPIGVLLLLWPTWWALWLASDGVPPLWTLFVFTAGVWLTRSAGCVINDYADRWLDPQVERTRDRPLATGAVSGREALLVFAVLMLVAFGLVLTLNRLTAWLSVVGVFLAASYPYLKRYTYLPQVYLGLAFGWGIPMAFAAVQPTTPGTRWWTARTISGRGPSPPRSFSVILIWSSRASCMRWCCWPCTWWEDRRPWGLVTGRPWEWPRSWSRGSSSWPTTGDGKHASGRSCTTTG
jgi:hypothetical protein